MKLLFIFFAWMVISPVFAQIISSPPIQTISSPMVPTYKKPLLPPEEPTPEEIAEEQPVKQAVKGAAISAGLLVVPQLLLKGFSNKYDKENCLAQNMFYKEDDATEKGFSYWSGLSLSAKDPATCITCCGAKDESAKTTKDLDAEINQRVEKQKKCTDTLDSVEKKKCQEDLDKEAFKNSAGCINQSDDKCNPNKGRVTKYIEQITNFCGKSKNNATDICLQMKEKK